MKPNIKLAEDGEMSSGLVEQTSYTQSFSLNELSDSDLQIEVQNVPKVLQGRIGSWLSAARGLDSNIMDKLDIIERYVMSTLIQRNKKESTDILKPVRQVIYALIVVQLFIFSINASAHQLLNVVLYQNYLVDFMNFLKSIETTFYVSHISLVFKLLGFPSIPELKIKIEDLLNTAENAI